MKLSGVEPSSQTSVNLVIDEFLADLQPPSVSEKTAKYYADQVGRALRSYLLASCEDIEDATPRVMRGYLPHEMSTPKMVPAGGKLRRPQISTQSLGPYSLDHRYRTASRFFNWCVENDYLETSPMARVKRPIVPKFVREGLTAAQVKLIVRAAGDGPGPIPIRDEAIVRLLIGAGLRADELLSMRLGRLSLQTRRAIIRGKGAREGTIAFGQDTADAIGRWLDVRYPVEDDHVWISQRRGPLKYGALRAMLASIEERTGIAFSTHILRHTAASLYHAAHGDLVATKEYLRHADVQTTMRYLKMLGQDYNVTAGYATPDELVL